MCLSLCACGSSETAEPVETTVETTVPETTIPETTVPETEPTPENKLRSFADVYVVCADDDCMIIGINKAEIAFVHNGEMITILYE